MLLPPLPLPTSTNRSDIVPLGQMKSSFNHSTTDKRVLNMENVVNDDDNVKQDLSIDVYGRKVRVGGRACGVGGGLLTLWPGQVNTFLMAAD